MKYLLTCLSTLLLLSVTAQDKEKMGMGQGRVTSIVRQGNVARVTARRFNYEYRCTFECMPDTIKVGKVVSLVDYIRVK